MSHASDGLTVVVTRPAAQSARFIELARAAGAECIAYPTLQIEPLSLSVATLTQLRSRRWDWAIFTSANAVATLFQQVAPPLATQHVAVGRATARALEVADVMVDARPASASSEGVLALPEFADLTGRGVVIVKGAGGRTLLRETLHSRGAHVLELETYQRVPVPPTATMATDLHAALMSDKPLVVTVTSAEVLQSLLDHVPAADDIALRRRPLVVPGARVAAAAVQLGWQGLIVQATTAEDDAMVQATLSVARGAPPAA